MTKAQKAILQAGYLLYLLVLVWIILFHGTLETLNSAFDPDFRAINLYPYFNGSESLLNMLIFAPVGAYVSALSGKNGVFKSLVSILATTLLFEIIQYIMAIGTTDVMDVINNTIGGIAGVVFVLFAMKLLRERFYKIATPVAALATIGVAIIALFVPLR